MEEFVKMSPKGQLVVPQDIREKENFKPGDRFIAVKLPDGVLFKKVEMPNIKKIAEEVKSFYGKGGRMPMKEILKDLRDETDRF